MAIKICGLRTAEAAEAAVEAGADYIGTVFIDGSPRQVTAAEARAVASAVGGRAEVVGLYKNIACDFRPPDFIHVLQPYGRLPQPWVEQWPAVRMIKPLAYDRQSLAGDLVAWDRRFRQNARIIAVLVDAPDLRRVGGGTGRSFDWEALREMLDEAKVTVPIALAGGLTADNVARAIQAVRPAMVDVSSGVESRRGVKDMAKIRDFCQAVRGA